MKEGGDATALPTGKEEEGENCLGEGEKEDEPALMDQRDEGE